MEPIETDEAPAAIGPYSQGIADGDRIYVSGQGPFEPSSGEIVEGGISEQTERTLKNIEAILEAGGSELGNIVKTTVYLEDMDEYEEMNEAYAEYLEKPFPARAAVEVGEFPVDVNVEIQAVATR